MMILGLTGSIGMGKSTATRAFARHGATIWDADAAVHRLMARGGAAVTAVTAAFPEARVEESGDVAVDRPTLGKLVFQDAVALRQLESILHPMVRRAERRFLATAKSRRCRLVVLDIPLLFETGGDARCDATAVVSAPEFVQRARVLARANMTVHKYDAILARQMSDGEKRRRADFVIRTGLNKRDSEQTIRRVADILVARRGTHWPLCWPATAS
ncbi:MAG: dephospho-CoA kinase [Proteobacteria bacterium]|nr:dephospho-CoA kinase [Pseudomonadota bacterium]MDA1356216.1 dephospho-CoA kinase [Pseudomonadota bacterium]